MNKTYFHIVVTAVALLLFALTAPSRAATGYFVVNGDINSGESPTYTGAAVVSDSPTHFWNGLSPAGATSTFTSLLESDGSADSGISFTIDGPTTGVSVNTVDFGSSGTLPATDLLRDIVYNRDNDGGHTGNDATETFSFTNVPAGTYDLYLYSINGNHQSADTLFTITTGGSGSEEALNASTIGFVVNNNYVEFTGLSPVGGVISGTILDNSGASHGASALNGFQLVDTPEPASLGLLIVGGTLLLRRRRGR